MKLPRYLIVILGAAIALSACGGDESTSSDDSAKSTSSTETSTTQSSEGSDEESGGSSDEGKSIFTSKCGGCHTLSDAGTSGVVGQNLDEISLDAAAIEAQIKNGGGGMPGGLIDGDERTAVAAYVAAQAAKK